MPADGDGEIEPLLSNEANERWAVVSPDGAMIAYGADEQDAMEVFVQRYPRMGARLRVTNGGGGEPVWHVTDDDTTLYYRRGDEIFAVPDTATPELSVGRARLVHRGEYDVGPPATSTSTSHPTDDCC